MLNTLKIKNVALIDHLELCFENGFNAIMGETGAGKSIILDALNFVLGAKADKTLITSGKEKMFVEAVFSSYGKDVESVMEDLGIENEEILIVSRSLTVDGKSEIRINGNMATLTMLKSLTKLLVDSYSQHESTSLLQSKNHLAVIDEYKPEFLLGEKEQISSLVDERNQIENQIASLSGKGENRERYLDLLKYQIDEIETFSPSVQDEEDLIERFKILQNSEKISKTMEEIVEGLDSSQFSALPSLKQALRSLNQIQSLSDEYASCYERLNSAIYEIDDIASFFKHSQNSIRFDEKEFAVIDERLDKYKSLKKKYGSTVDEILSFLENAKKEYDDLTLGEEKLNQLSKELEQINKKLEGVCEALSKKRKDLATQIEQKIVGELQYLGMKGSSLKFEFSKQNIQRNGFDDVEILFSANKGESLKPLSKIISGGELSRFMLALKTVVKADENSYIFDEIDSGISGETGQAVGERIAMLSLSNQVILISHLPQVCAMADKFFYVYKTVAERTNSNVKVLEGDEILGEIARLSGGDKTSTLAIAHAKEMFERARSFKLNLQKSI